ncbi:MAG: putative DNA binding domain-containing protein [Flexilinea sp.]|nr:putative DNA binding domain-containing protein [Flexilinea sp.]
MTSQVNRLNIGAETEQVEFKKSTGELKEGVISIASILNKHESGDLYFGIKNNGDVIGQEISDSTLRDVSQAIRMNIKPALYPMIEKQIYAGLDVVHVKFEGKRRPYTAYNIPRIRIADEDTVMDQELYREMMNERENRTDSWETKSSKYHISDIDIEVFSDYLQKAKEAGRISFRSTDPEAVMAKLELADGDTLLNAGAALFVDCGINELQMAKFASDERLTFTDIKRYTGLIFDLADKAVQYVTDAMDWRVEFDGSLERKEYPEIPVSAVREAVINAFGHRIIESMQAVEIAIYRSYIDIYSPGNFPDHVSPEQFIEEERKPIRRNPLITRTLYYSKDMEAFATGLKRINDTCTEAGVKVEFLRDEYGFTVRFYRHCGEGWNIAHQYHHTDLHLGEEKGEENRRNVVLELIKENPKISMANISEQTGLTKRQVERTILTLKSDGIIFRDGPDKGGMWIVNKE